MMQTNSTALTQSQSIAGFWRRAAAIFYDSLIVAAIAFVVSNLYLICYQLLNQTTNTTPSAQVLQLTLFPLIILSCFTFFTWFWLHGGRTLGMRAWHLRVVTQNKEQLSLQQASIRFTASLLSWSCLGLGFLWVLIDKQNLSWHDRLSGSQLIIDKSKSLNS